MRLLPLDQRSLAPTSFIGTPFQQGGVAGSGEHAQGFGKRSRTARAGCTGGSQAVSRTIRAIRLMPWLDDGDKLTPTARGDR